MSIIELVKDDKYNNIILDILKMNIELLHKRDVNIPLIIALENKAYDNFFSLCELYENNILEEDYKKLIYLSIISEWRIIEESDDYPNYKIPMFLFDYVLNTFMQKVTREDVILAIDLEDSEKLDALLSYINEPILPNEFEFKNFIDNEMYEYTPLNMRQILLDWKNCFEEKWDTIPIGYRAKSYYERYKLKSNLTQ